MGCGSQKVQETDVFFEKCDARGSAQRRRRPWRRRRKRIPRKDQKHNFLTKNETTFLRARDGEGAQSCGSDRFVVVSAVTSSCELDDLLLHAETAGKQLITDIANVPLVCAMKVLNLINDGSCTLLCSFVPASWTGISTSLRLHLHCRSVFVLDSNPLQR